MQGELSTEDGCILTELLIANAMGIGTFILVSIVKILLAVFVLLTAVAYTTLLERKVVAHMQNRWGPTRVGPFGIWQPLGGRLKVYL